jgi:hypothetical protein
MIMKKILLVAAVAALAACNNSDNAKVESMNKDSSASTKMDDDNMNYPYTADYSHNFEIGSSKNAMTILQLYKEWDGNNLDNAKNLFAENNDTMVFADGNMFIGSRDTLFSIAKQMRGQMGTVVDSVHAWVPLRSKDKNEDWVLIWTREIATDAKGKKTSRELQETWRFDKDGKINLCYQYEQQPPKMPPPPPPAKK